MRKTRKYIRVAESVGKYLNPTPTPTFPKFPTPTPCHQRNEIWLLKSMEIVMHKQKSLFQQKFHNKLYHFNRNSQFKSVISKMIQLGIRSRSRKKIRLRLPALAGTRLRFHPKTSDSLRLRLPSPEVYFLCCDRKARAASAQSFRLW